MAIEPNDIALWVQKNAPTASLETDQRVVAVRAYYSAYHSCLNNLGIAPLTTEECSGGVHKRFIAALKLNSDTKIKSLGRKLEYIHLKRVAADYNLNEDFSRHEMVDTITFSNKIISLIDDIQKLREAEV